MLSFLTRQWFLLALALSLALGFGGGKGLGPLADAAWFRSGVVAAVMFLMGLTLRPQVMIGSIRRPRAWSLAVLINAAGVPLLAILPAMALSPALGGGLLVAVVVPCTLASASVWTRKAAGDDAVAMMVTVLTNLFCFAIAPIWLIVLLGQRVQITFADQALKLALLVALPLLVAQGVRRLGLARWADANKKGLSVLAQLGILVMVVVGAYQASRRFPAVGLSGVDWVDSVAMVFAAGGVHVTALLLGVGLARAIRLSAAEQIAVGISGSQKTLMVGLQIAIDCGVSVLPMIAYHVGQLLIDTIAAQWWAGQTHPATTLSAASDNGGDDGDRDE